MVSTTTLTNLMLKYACELAAAGMTKDEVERNLEYAVQSVMHQL